VGTTYPLTRQTPSKSLKSTICRPSPFYISQKICIFAIAQHPRHRHTLHLLRAVHHRRGFAAGRQELWRTEVKNADSNHIFTIPPSAVIFIINAVCFAPSMVVKTSSSPCPPVPRSLIASLAIVLLFFLGFAVIVEHHYPAATLAASFAG